MQLMENQENQNKKSLSVIITIVVLALGAVVALGAAFFRDNPSQAKNEDTTTDTTVDNTPVTQNPKSYKDGTYQVSQSYQSPGGTEHFNLSITLANNTVTGASFTPGAVSPTGKRLQGQFSQGFQQLVVGQNIDQINLQAVSGASLTSAAFDQALEQIKQQAAS